MKKFFSLLILFVPLFALAKESCSLEEVELNSKSPIAQRLFYVGTCHFRKKEYGESVRLWKILSELPNVDPKYVELQTSSLNNLGYMLFFGYGIAEDKNQAVAYWKKAVELGHTESEYHLCHAYGNIAESTYAAVKAIPHCEKAKLIYQGMPEKTSDEKVILKQIDDYLFRLKK